MIFLDILSNKITKYYIKDLKTLNIILYRIITLDFMQEFL